MRGFFLHESAGECNLIDLGTKEFWKNTIALSIGSLVIFANVYLTQPLLPEFTEEFGITPLISGLSVSLVIFALGISLFFYGPISDAVGRRGIMITTMSLSVGTTFAAAFAPNFEILLVFRVLQGVFLAGLPSIALAYIGDEFSKKALSLAIGIYISGNTVGGMVGRVVSGIVTDFLDWRWAFIVMGMISLVCLIVFIALLRPSQHFKAKPFLWQEAVSDYRGHIKNPTLRVAYLLAGLHFLIFVGQFNYVTYLLSSSPYYLPTSLIGLLFVTYLAGTVSSTVAGKLSSRFSQSIGIGIGILFMVSGLVITLVLTVWSIIVGLLLSCFGFFFAHSIASAWVSRRAKYAKASASGLYLIFYYIGGSLGGLYLDGFWQYWSWPGVVFGCLLILVVTTICMWNMYKIEAIEKSQVGVYKASR
jgi:YNFM family putative membrane transporter